MKEPTAELAICYVKQPHASLASKSESVSIDHLHRSRIRPKTHPSINQSNQSLISNPSSPQSPISQPPQSLNPPNPSTNLPLNPNHSKQTPNPKNPILSPPSTNHPSTSPIIHTTNMTPSPTRQLLGYIDRIEAGRGKRRIMLIYEYINISI